jgi:hypothetical protein
MVALELGAARFALAQAASDRSRLWQTLAGLAEVPQAPQPLADPPTRGGSGPAALPDAAEPPADPDAPASSEPPADRERLRRAAVWRAIEARLVLSEATARFAAARELSRWSLRWGVEREGDEDAAHLGASYRFLRGGAAAATDLAVETELAAARREAELDRSALAARLAAAQALSRFYARQAEPLDPSGPLAALELRLREGKSRPSEALPLRRQLLAASEAALERQAARARLSLELTALTAEVQP